MSHIQTPRSPIVNIKHFLLQDFKKRYLKDSRNSLIDRYASFSFQLAYLVVYDLGYIGSLSFLALHYCFILLVFEMLFLE